MCMDTMVLIQKETTRRKTALLVSCQMATNSNLATRVAKITLWCPMVLKSPSILRMTEVQAMELILQAIGITRPNIIQTEVKQVKPQTNIDINVWIQMEILLRDKLLSRARSLSWCINHWIAFTIQITLRLNKHLLLNNLRQTIFFKNLKKIWLIIRVSFNILMLQPWKILPQAWARLQKIIPSLNLKTRRLKKNLKTKVWTLTVRKKLINLLKLLLWKLKLLLIFKTRIWSWQLLLNLSRSRSRDKKPHKSLHLMKKN